MSQRMPDYESLRAAQARAQAYDPEREYQFALFRRADTDIARPFDNAILRSRKQAEEYMKLNYLENVWPSLEVRFRPAPVRWGRLGA